MQNLQKWQLLKKKKTEKKRIRKINRTTSHPWRRSGWISESFPAHRTQPSTLWKSRIPIRVEKVSYGNPSCLSLVSYVPTPLPYTHPLPLWLPTQLCCSITHQIQSARRSTGGHDLSVHLWPSCPNSDSIVWQRGCRWQVDLFTIDIDVYRCVFSPLEWEGERAGGRVHMAVERL